MNQKLKRTAFSLNVFTVTFDEFISGAICNKNITDSKLLNGIYLLTKVE